MYSALKPSKRREEFRQRQLQSLKRAEALRAYIIARIGTRAESQAKERTK